MTEQATDLTAEERIVYALGRMPYLPAATEKRVRLRDSSLQSLDTLADVLEDLAVYLAGVADEADRLELGLQQLQSDIDAVRRVFGRSL